MEEVGTRPDIRDSIIYHLSTWKNPHHSNTNTVTHIDLQQECGWQSFIEGFINREWGNAQQSFYMSIQSRRTGKRWTIELIKKLWMVAWDQWEHRNAVLYDQENLVQKEELLRLNMRITQAYQEYKYILPTTDQHFFTSPLTTLLRKSTRLKEAWLTQVTAAKNRAVRRQRQRTIARADRASRRHHLRSHTATIINMQQRMRQWLQLAR